MISLLISLPLGSQTWEVEGRTFTVTIRDSVEDYTQLMKEIFDFDLLKKLINGTDDQPPFKFVASAMYGGEFPIVIESSLNHFISIHANSFSPSLCPSLSLLSFPSSPTCTCTCTIYNVHLYLSVSLFLCIHQCIPANSHALGMSLMPAG